jgi:hypothetical protein
MMCISIWWLALLPLIVIGTAYFVFWLIFKDWSYNP